MHIRLVVHMQATQLTISLEHDDSYIDSHVDHHIVYGC
jgi:hypothetical protein